MNTGNPDKGRFAARLALIVAFLFAAAMPVVAFIVRGPDKLETWTITAAALAVITSVIAAWSSRRVVELQEDAQLPKPFPIFDFHSRYGLVILRLTNSGGAPAHNISLEWNMELKNQKDETIGFPKKSDAPAVSVLLPGESISQVIGVPHKFLAAHPDAEYTGFTNYHDVSGRSYRQPFRLDGRHYSGTLTYDDEALRTHYELQKIPDEIKALKKVIEKITQKYDS